MCGSMVDIQSPTAEIRRGKKRKIEARNFLYMLPVAVALSSSDNNAIRYVLPVLRMTSYFHIMGQIPMQTWSQRRSESFTMTRQMAPLNCPYGGEVCYPQLSFYVSVYSTLYCY